MFIVHGGSQKRILSQRDAQDPILVADRLVRHIFWQGCRVPSVRGKLKAAAKLSDFGYPNANKVILIVIYINARFVQIHIKASR